MIQLSRIGGDETFRRRLFNALTTASTFPERGRLANDDVFSQLTADSYRVVGREGDEYFVRILVSDGETFINCSCDGGRNNIPCYHVGAVMLKRGLAVSVGNQFALYTERPAVNKTQPISEVILLPGMTLTTKANATVRVVVFPV